MTASGLPRNIGAAPSHTAQAETPLFQKPPGPSPEPGKSSRFATAPVATTTVSASTSRPSAEETRKGRRDRSTSVTVSE